MNVNRYYICDNCDYCFVVLQDINDNILKRCPKCNKKKLYQDLTGQHTYIYGSPTTLGHQASRNTEQMGKYELQEKRQREKIERRRQVRQPLVERGIISEANLEKEPETPWFGKLDKTKEQQINNDSTGKIAHKYIMEGK